MDLHLFRARCRGLVVSFPRCRRRQFLLVTILLLFVCLTMKPSPLMGESEQIKAAKQQQLTKIQTALALQSTMSPAARARVAQSIKKSSDKYSLDPMLVLAIIQVESHFDHKAVSSSGAQGLMQVQPAAVTALVREGKVPRVKAQRIKDPPINVELGVSYLAYLRDLFGDWKVALTAYNSGPSLVSKKIAANENLALGYARRVLSARRELNQQLAALEQTETNTDEISSAG